MADDEQFYATVAKEIANGQIDKILWTKAFANSGGEEIATKSLYCRLRAEQLQSAAGQQHRSAQIAFTKAHAKQLGFGSLAFFLGLLITGLSYSAANAGGHYIFSYGLIFGGFVAICKGLSGILRSQLMRANPAAKVSKDTPTPSESFKTSQNTSAANPASEDAINIATQAIPPDQRSATESKGNISTLTGCLIFIFATIIIAIVISIGFTANIDKHNSTSTPYAAAESPRSSLVDRRAALSKTLSELDAEYRALNSRRATLDSNNPNQLSTFNRDAADYMRRVQLARDEKARLEQPVPAISSPPSLPARQ